MRYSIFHANVNVISFPKVVWYFHRIVSKTEAYIRDGWMTLFIQIFEFYSVYVYIYACRADRHQQRQWQNLHINYDILLTHVWVCELEYDRTLDVVVHHVTPPYLNIPNPPPQFSYPQRIEDSHVFDRRRLSYRGVAISSFIRIAWSERHSTHV